jgi:hypothetical protein
MLAKPILETEIQEAPKSSETRFHRKKEMFELFG